LNLAVYSSIPQEKGGVRSIVFGAIAVIQIQAAETQVHRSEMTSKERSGDIVHTLNISSVWISLLE